MPDIFYKVPKNIQKDLCRESIDLAYWISLEHLPKGSYRESFSGMTILESLKLLKEKTHFVFICRQPQSYSVEYYEIGFSTLRGKDIFLFIRVSREKGEYLREKYKLKEL